VLANAYDSGFSTCWPEGSRKLLSLLKASIDSSSPSDAPGQWLDQCLETSVQNFLSWSNAEQAGPLEDSAATMTVVLKRPDSLIIRWCGAERLQLGRSGESIEDLTPHSIAEEFRRHGHPVNDPQLEQCVTKSINSEAHSFEATTWDWTPGDKLMFYHPKAAGRGTPPSPSELKELQLPFWLRVTTQIS